MDLYRHGSLGLLQDFCIQTIFGYGQSRLWICEDAANEVGLEELDELIPIGAKDGAGRIDDQLKVYLFIGATT